MLELVRKQRPNLGLTVSATTRAPRPGEVEGVSYRFMSEESFEKGVAEGAFLEWAHVHGHCYGTLRSDVEHLIAGGTSVVLEIDPQGAFQVKKVLPEAVLIFIEPPSLEILEQRLRARGTEDEASIELRLKNAHHELELAKDYDARLVNDDLDEAVRKLAAIFDSFEMDGGNSQNGSY